MTAQFCREYAVTADFADWDNASQALPALRYRADGFTVDNAAAAALAA